MINIYSKDARIRIEPKLAKLDRLIESITGDDAPYDNTNSEELIDNRLYLLSTLLETLSTWEVKGDCLPTLTKLGRFSDDWIYVQIIHTDKAMEIFKNDL